MCGPLVTAALTLAGGAMQGMAARRQLQAQSASLEAQAKFNQRQAEIERQKGTFEAGRVQDQARRLAGDQVAAFASSGVDLTGSTGHVIDDSAAEAALDVLAVRQNATLRADNQSFLADQNRVNAANARAAVPLATLTPIIAGASKINWGGLFAQNT